MHDVERMQAAADRAAGFAVWWLDEDDKPAAVVFMERVTADTLMARWAEVCDGDADKTRFLLLSRDVPWRELATPEPWTHPAVFDVFVLEVAA